MPAATEIACDVNPYSASAVCGSGFTAIGKAVKEGVGTKTPMHAFIQTASDAKGNTGDFAYYAGPVKMRAAGRCVMWGGSATARRSVTSWRTSFHFLDTGWLIDEARFRAPSHGWVVR